MHGQLNDDRSNAVLMLPAIGSTHHRLDFLIGTDRAFDPAHWCLICADTWGNGLATSPSNSVRQPSWAFPRFSIRDMVNAQARLVRQLGIERLAAVVGASMGGMQALQWGVSYPEVVGRLIAMTPMARTSIWAMAVNEVSRSILGVSPGQTQPFDESRWAGWVGLMQFLIGRSPPAIEREFGQLQDVRQFLNARVKDQMASGASPINWWYQSHAYDAHDVGQTPGFHGDTVAALASLRAPTLVMGPDIDLYNPAHAWRELVRHIPQGMGVLIPSDMGHQSATHTRPEDQQFICLTIREWMARASTSQAQ